jgi:hypothetical protein
MKVWNSIPEVFDCLKNVATAVLSVFSITHLCESLFSVVNFVKSNYRSRLHEKACIALKTTKYKPDI